MENTTRISDKDKNNRILLNVVYKIYNIYNGSDDNFTVIQCSLNQ